MVSIQGLRSKTYFADITPSTIVVCFTAISVLAGLVVWPLTQLWMKDVVSPNFWFDESGQFWLSRGLYHYSDPLANDGGWAGMFYHGRGFNSDPSGFTFLLRGWMDLFGTSPVALRSLPFFFFVLTSIAIFLSAWRCGANLAVSSLACAIPMGFSALLTYSTELRAYSMEALCVVYLFFLFCFVKRDTKYLSLLILGLIAAVLSLSRFSAFLFSVAACITLLTTVFRGDRLGICKKIACFALPVAIAVISGYLLFGTEANFKPRARPHYVDSLLLQLQDGPTRFNTFRTNFLSTYGLPTTLYVLLAPLFFWFGPERISWLRPVVGRTAIFSVISILLAVFASFLGILPWDIQSRWSIGFHALSCACLAMTVIVVGTWFQTSPRWPVAGPAIITMVLAVVWYIPQREAFKSNRPTLSGSEGRLLEMAGLSVLAERADAHDLRFFIQLTQSPTVRYLCEFGPLKGKFDYPQKFHFETGQEEKQFSEIPSKSFDIVVAHPDTIKIYAPRVVGAPVKPVVSEAPACLEILDTSDTL